MNENNSKSKRITKCKRKIKCLEGEKHLSPVNLKVRYQVEVILPQWRKTSKMDAYLITCERLLLGAQEPRSLWVVHIIPKLPEKARTVYNRIPLQLCNVYDDLKKEMLDRHALSASTYRNNFFSWDKHDQQTYK